MKKIVGLLLSVVVIAFLYYLLIRPFEFEVNLKANTLPGDLIETIRIWSRSLDSAKVVEVDSFSRLKQTIVWKKRSYVYDWKFRVINDSTTQVNIQIAEPGRRVINKLLVPFTNQPIESDASEIANQFYEILKVHLSITRVKIEGEAELGSSFCVCRPLETSQIEKANGMMMDYSLLTAFIDDFKLKIDGAPSVRVREWNHNLGLLKFDFCFPIIETDSLPVTNVIAYKTFKGEKAIKAEYRGNYITSDRAWYALLSYAIRNGYKTNGMPIEYFHDNPTLGMNEKNWKADVYLPVVDFHANEKK